uniref:Grancalcin-like n=1 Tax=Sinocyclocheilus rhinocerous TaxID=307959 RepID=A0A673HM98_9TELE
TALFGGPPMPGVPAQGMAMPGVPAQGMAMPGVPAAGGYPAQPYAGYPGTFSAPPTQDPMWGYFTAVAGQVRAACVNVDIMSFLSPPVVTCSNMIRDYTGKMGFSEFKELFAVLNGWKQNFAMVDRDCSGTVEPHEMSQCIANMGYRISPQALNAIIKRYSRSGKIYFDDYVACFVKLRALTGEGAIQIHTKLGYYNCAYYSYTACCLNTNSLLKMFMIKQYETIFFFCRQFQEERCNAARNGELPV